MVLWWRVASAQETEPVPPPAPEEPIVILPIDEVVPSAIDEVDEVRTEGAAPGLLAGSLAGGLVRGKLFVRPLVGIATHDGAAALRAGAAVGHGWWTIEELPIQIGGETALRVSAPIGGAEGYRLELGTAAGPWLGPVGIRIGPALRFDREQWDADVLDPALGLGGTLDLTVDLGPLALVAGVQPMWALSDARTAAPSGRWPAIGTETAYRAGLAVSIPYADLLAEVTDRVTPIGPITEYVLGIRLRLLRGS